MRMPFPSELTWAKQHDLAHLVLAVERESMVHHVPPVAGPGVEKKGERVGSPDILVGG